MATACSWIPRIASCGSSISAAGTPPVAYFVDPIPPVVMFEIDKRVVVRSRSIGSFISMSQDTSSSSEPPIDRNSATDIVYPSTIPFIIVHLTCFAAIWTGVTAGAAALGIGLYWLRIFAIGAGSIATSPTVPTRPAGLSSSFSRRSRSRRRRRASCGGPPTIATTTSIPIRNSTFTRRGRWASSIAMSAGSSPAARTR